MEKKRKKKMMKNMEIVIEEKCLKVVDQMKKI
jgi:hypothetical protein